jgi:hypothetical protein
MAKLLSAGLVLLAGCAFAQTKEKPAGIIISSKNAQVRPAGASTPLELAVDDYLFPGDTPDGGQQQRRRSALRQGCRIQPALERRIYGRRERDPRRQRSPSSTPRPPILRFVGYPTDLASARRRALIHLTPSKNRGREDKLGDLPLGPTYALVVGISQYQNLDQKYWLKFADADAETFAGFLASPRGGAVAGEERIKLLINAEATREAVRNYMRLYLQKARDNHGTFLLVLAAHGFVDDKTREANILTHESDVEDLSTSGLPMDELADVLSEGLGGLGRMLIFVDVCHAAEIRGIRSNLKRNGVIGAIQVAISQLPGQIFSFVSSKETEPSYEGPNWGGGHGAFTYFVLRGLNGEADKNGDGVVSAQELLDYLGNMVKETTRDAQHPKELTVTLENAASLAQGSKAEFRRRMCPAAGRARAGSLPHRHQLRSRPLLTNSRRRLARDAFYQEILKARTRFSAGSSPQGPRRTVSPKTSCESRWRTKGRKRFCNIFRATR